MDAIQPLHPGDLEEIEAEVAWIDELGPDSMKTYEVALELVHTWVARMIVTIRTLQGEQS